MAEDIEGDQPAGGGPLVRAVLDTSTLFDPELRRELQIAAFNGLYVAIWSPWIVGELYRVLTVRKIEQGWTASRISQSSKNMMRLLEPVFDVAAPRLPYPSPWPEFSDMDDHPIWALAVAQHADYVISENTKHFPPLNVLGRHEYNRIQYMGGRDFLQDVLLLGDET